MASVGISGGKGDWGCEVFSIKRQLGLRRGNNGGYSVDKGYEGFLPLGVFWRYPEPPTLVVGLGGSGFLF